MSFPLLNVFRYLPRGRKYMKASFFCGLLVCLQLIFACTAHRVEELAPKDNLSYPLPQPESKIQVKTWDGSPNLEPGLNGKDVVLFEDFEDQNYQQWPVHWGKPPFWGTVTAPSQYVFAGKQSAYLQALKGKREALGGGEYVPKRPIGDVAFVRLYLRLEDKFSIGTAQQLKLFSIRAGAGVENAYGGAGKRPNGKDKFSVDLALDNWMKLHFYYYHPNQGGPWGDWTYCQTSFFHKAGLSPGKWYCIELMLQANTPGQGNGQLKAWLDGRLIGSVEKLRFRDVDTVKIRRITVEGYFGGSDALDISPKDQRIYFDNFVVSTKPIGCLGAGH